MSKTIDKILKEIEKIKEQFQKNPNRALSSIYILNKTTLVKQNYQEFKKEYAKLIEAKTPISVTDYYKQKYIAIYEHLNRLLDARSEELLNLTISQESEEQEDISRNENSKLINMADFNIITASKFITEFEGDASKLVNFLNTIECLNDALKDTDKEKLIKFVLNTKLSEKVRCKLITIKTPKTFQELKHTFGQIFQNKKNAINLQTELMTIAQGRLVMEAYVEKIEKIFYELCTIQSIDQDDVVKTTIVNINDQLALNAFKRGLNEPTRSTFIAARPKILSEAVNIALECNLNEKSANVYNIKNNYSNNNNNYNRRRNGHNNNYNNKNRPNNNNNNGNRNNSNYYNNGNRSNNNSNSNGNRNNGYNGNRNNYNKNNNGNRNFSNNRNNNQRANVHYIAGNGQGVHGIHQSEDSNALII